MRTENYFDVHLPKTKYQAGGTPFVTRSARRDLEGTRSPKLQFSDVLRTLEEDPCRPCSSLSSTA